MLFPDMLREWANNMLAHVEANMPSPVDFEYETIPDARRFEHPANYALPIRETELTKVPF
ncbi:MAG: DUF3141 domain-containing protein [Polaromonas sp.]|nr:DUF3141 domain-containing protein [Polaromonas sp.]